MNQMSPMITSANSERYASLASWRFLTAAIRTALVCALMLPAGAWATDHPGSVATRSAAGPADQLAEVVVTANRKKERLQDVPITVTAVSGEEIQRQGVTDPEDLAKIAPTLITSSGASDPQGTNFSIRGVGTASFQRTIEPSVGVVLDGVTLIRPEMAIIDLLDVAQVEILNGPQGFLFGKNASAGVIIINTTDPVIGATSERIRAEYGGLDTGNDTSEYRVQSVSNLAISEDSALRVSLVDQHYTPIVRNLVSDPNVDAGLREVGGTLKYLWRPSDRLSLLLSGDFMPSRGQGAGFATFRSVAPGSPDGALLAGTGLNPGSDNTKSAIDAPQNFDLKVGGTQLRAEYAITDGLKLTDIAAYRRSYFDQAFDADFGPAPLLNSYGETHSVREFTDELRLASTSNSKLDYQAGLYYLVGLVNDTSVLGADLGQAPPPGFTWVLASDAAEQEALSSYAAFGQGTYKLSDFWKATIGARVTHDRVGMTYYSDPYGGVAHLIPPTPRLSGSVDDTNVSERGTLQYEPNQGLMFYGTLARGYKGPGYSQFSLIAVHPEIPTMFEVGLKSELLDRRLNIDFSVYDEEFKDFQAEAVDFRTFEYIVRNAGKLATRGADLQISAVPVAGLTISGALSYNNAHFASFTDNLCYTGQPDCVNGVTNSSGQPLPFSSRWKGLVDIRYEHPVTNRLIASIGLGVQSQTAYNVFSNGNPAGLVAGRTTFDLDAGVHSDDDRWTLRVFCRNCTDKVFPDDIQSHPLFTADYVQTFGYTSFRQLGVDVDLRF